MGLGESIVTCLQKYATFRGRAGLAEYWWFALACILITAPTRIFDALIGWGARVEWGPVGIESSPLGGLLGLALTVPLLAVGSRRLHDTGRSGWWQLVALVPIVGWVVVAGLLTVADRGPNRYGPSPQGNLGPLLVADPPAGPAQSG